MPLFGCKAILAQLGARRLLRALGGFKEDALGERAQVKHPCSQAHEQDEEKDFGADGHGLVASLLEAGKSLDDGPGDLLLEGGIGKRRGVLHRGPDGPIRWPRRER